MSNADATRTSTDISGAATPSAATPSQGPLVPGQHFADRYLIVKLLGLGGMGAVYQAWDTKLSLVVALKVIRREAGADQVSAQVLERRVKEGPLLRQPG